MVEIPGYETLAVLHTSADVVVLDARRKADGRPVILKLATARRPSSAIIARFDHEHRIASQVPPDHAVRCLAREQVDARPMLVFERPEGRPLDRMIAERPLPLATFLDIAISLTAALDAVHRQDILHKDVRPANVIVGDSPLKARLTDFGIAERVTRDGSGSQSVTGLQGTLGYISPEQTGRMNRGIDFRSDLYSLGVTFYELLTRRLPFEGHSSLELIHGHIARPPPPLRSLRAELPEVLAALVAKLMAKSPEDRYQSSTALEADLRRCRDGLTTTGSIPPFQLAEGDISDRLILSQRLYGRDAERDRLFRLLDRARTGQAGLVVITVTGRGGIGKTSLIQELGRVGPQGGAHFISGKFSQYKRGRPYSALIDAFDDLAQQLMTLGEGELDHWRTALTLALGNNAAVITEVLPGFERILGPQPEPPALDRADAQHRFQFVFQAFVRVFCQPDHPLVLFLDDLQWADHATVALLESLIRDEGSAHLVFVASYRDHEVTLADPFPRALRRLEEASVPIERIELHPLEVDSITSLIADSLSCSPARAASLAALVLAKTLGNPYFVRQFLTHLADIGALRFDHDARAWAWDDAQIRALDITDNVVDLMAGKLLELDPDSQRTLRLAACVGSQFEVGTLAVIAGITDEQVTEQLEQAVVEGLIVPTRARSAHGDILSTAQGGGVHSYRFRHDRVHQAAYSLIPEAERAQLHLGIGRRMLLLAQGPQLQERVFDIVDQLQEGVGLMRERAEIDGLMRLHGAAARRSMEALAYAAALEHVRHALQLSTGDLWTTDYPLALALHVDGASAAVMTGEIDQMHTLCESILQRSAEVYDKLPAYSILINHHFAASDQVNKALDLALDALAELGLHLPRRPTALHAAWYLLKTKLALRNRPPEKLAGLPMMTDRRVEAILRLLVSVDGVAYMANPNSFAICAMAAVQLSQRHGHTSASGWGYNLYGAILAAGMGDIPGGLAISTFGFDLARKLDDVWMQSRIAAPYYITVAHWSMPMQDMVKPLQEGIEQAMGLGAYNPAGANLMYLQFYRFFAGTPLAILADEQREAMKFAGAIEQGIAVDFTAVFHALTTALLGSGQGVDTGALAADQLTRFEAAGNKNGVFTVHLARGLLALLLGDEPQALVHSDRATAGEASAAGTILSIQQMFYRCLIVARAPGAPLRELRWRLKKLRAWQGFCAHNFEHKADLVEAELRRLEARRDEAAALFDQAHRKALQRGFLHEAAMIAERAAACQRDIGSPTAAEMWLVEAQHGHERWGAAPVLSRLSRELREPGAGPDTRAATRRRAIAQPDDPHQTFDDTGDGGLDVATILRSTGAVLREMDLERLLTTVMKAAVENAGAQRGALLLRTDHGLTVEASHPRDDGPIELCGRIVDYVRRSLEQIVLDDASSHGRFAQDPYIKANTVRSVLCVPLINQTELVAVLYLENNLAPAAFTRDRIDLLMLLAAQAAISIRNARLYTAQVRLTEAYSRFVPREFLRQLGRESILHVGLGDQIEKDMAVLFADIRAFTAISEQLSPKDNFAFLNEFLGCVSPVTRHHHGFVDKYIGDGIMALFPGGSSDAVRAAVAIHTEVTSLNGRRAARGEAPIALGVGVHVGRLMLGTIGESERMEGTVISDAVNIASRIEGLTKVFGARVLVSAEAWAAIADTEPWMVRYLGRIPIRGKREPVGIYEVLDAEPEVVRSRKLATAARLGEAVQALDAARPRQAEATLSALFDASPDDRALQVLLDYSRTGAPLEET